MSVCLDTKISHTLARFPANKGMREFKTRLRQHLPTLVNLLTSIYGPRFECELDGLLTTLADGFAERSQTLRKRDNFAINHPTWHKSETIVGMAVYIDLVANDIQGLIAQLPYYAELGITYLHLMPLYKSPEGDNDGGYAVSDYRQVNPSLGTIDDLRELAKAMAKYDMQMVLDFVFNHTSDEHPWALAAKRGEPRYRDYYLFFESAQEVAQYNKTVREIFPSVRRGSFTQQPDGSWVWTTFNSFQWDLNYSNPEVFRAICAEMIFLANVGCSVLRLDALAFIWKQVGTTCENQPYAHRLIQAFNTCLQIVAPSVVFKSEAIVHPDEVIQYIGKQECELSYNPLLMALIWNSMATRKTRLMTQSLSYRFAIPSECTWVNYARCHDDIGWTFDDRDARQIGINGHDHRLFLNKYYTNQYEGSFARGMGFQFNPSNGDCRVCGSLASLTGLEQALQQNDDHAKYLAVKRILLIHSIIMSIGGIPLLYQGDEIAMLNDYSFLQDDSKAHDARWVNRPKVTDSDRALINDTSSIQGQVYAGLKRMIEIRKSLPVFGDARTTVYNVGNDHCFGYLRAISGGDKVLCLINFSEQDQWIGADMLEKLNPANSAIDLLSGDRYPLQWSGDILLSPYKVIWLHTRA